jgi:bacteriorhodopsin
MQIDLETRFGLLTPTEAQVSCCRGFGTVCRLIKQRRLAGPRSAAPVGITVLLVSFKSYFSYLSKLSLSHVNEKDVCSGAGYARPLCWVCGCAP